MKRCMKCMREYGEENAFCVYCGHKPGEGDREHYYLPEGTVLQDRYIVGSVLGHGGFGITYIGYDQKFGLRVAIKEYLPAEISTRALGETMVTTFSGDKHDAYVYGLGRFIEEARTMAQFNSHPCIVSVSDYFEANNTAYIVMEYLDGITLNEYLSRCGGKISEQETLSIIHPIIDALKEVHRSGIIHRDISPDNIFILKNSQVKLLDFGAARHAMGEKSKSLSVVLKPGFAPPEQYYSKGKQGPWTDVYALGATMFRMLTGSNPTESMERMDRHAPQEMSGLEGISRNAASVILKALRLKAHERYQDMEAMQAALYYGENEPENAASLSEPVNQSAVQSDYGPNFDEDDSGGLAGFIADHKGAVIAVLSAAVIIVVLILVFTGNSSPGQSAAARSYPSEETESPTIETAEQVVPDSTPERTPERTPEPIPEPTPEPIPEPTPIGDYLIPGSDSRYISMADLAGLSDDEVQLARNEIYARYGYNFRNSAIQNYFERQSWYHNDPYYGYNANSITFNAYENANLSFIKQYERDMGWDETSM